MYIEVLDTDPSSYSCIAHLRSIIFLTGGAPAEARQHHDERDDVEQGCHDCEDHLHLEEGERQLDLDEITNLKKIEEGPEERNDETCDNDEEKPMIVSNTKGEICSVEGDVDGRSGAGHAHHSQDLTERGL